MDHDLDTIARSLNQERDALLDESSASSTDRAPVELDQQSVGRLSRMDAVAQQNMAAAAERSRQARIVRIDAALRRIEDGDFGFCVGCDEQIPAKRLQADLTNAFCVGCQTARE